MAAIELGPNIRVNGICPGLILPPVGSKEGSFQRMGEKIPLKSIGNPHYITSAVEYLLKNPYVTGECLFVDGGENLL
jgi:NAD(P)-dependent dehydrogenase (short-subunit alcohol dehydrogenase family)